MARLIRGAGTELSAFIRRRDARVALLLLGALVIASFVVRPNSFRNQTLLIEDLPPKAQPGAHVHGSESETRTRGEERAEMHHYATPDAQVRGGPIYGVYGYGIVALEYEIPVREIQRRPVGETDPGGALGEALGFAKRIS